MIKKAITLKLSLIGKPGTCKEAEDDAVMKKVDESGNIIGVSILKVSELKGQKPLSIDLAGHIAWPVGFTPLTMTRTTANTPGKDGCIRQSKGVVTVARLRFRFNKTIAGYPELFTDLKVRIRSAQVRATLSVNRELVLPCW